MDSSESVSSGAILASIVETPTNKRKGNKMKEQENRKHEPAQHETKISSRSHQIEKRGFKSNTSCKYEEDNKNTHKDISHQDKERASKSLLIEGVNKRQSNDLERSIGKVRKKNKRDEVNLKNRKKRDEISVEDKKHQRKDKHVRSSKEESESDQGSYHQQVFDPGIDEEDTKKNGNKVRNRLHQINNIKYEIKIKKDKQKIERDRKALLAPKANDSENDEVCVIKKKESPRFEKKSKSPKLHFEHACSYENKIDLSIEKSKTIHSRHTSKEPYHRGQTKIPYIPSYEHIQDNIAPFDRIPEVHFLGEIKDARGFKSNQRNTAISCKWSIDWGKSWSFIAGEYEGQTQYSSSTPKIDGNERIVWNHPLDIHFASVSIQGWPRLTLQVWKLDELGRICIAGYGFVHLPSHAGPHTVKIPCWRPIGTLTQELNAFFLGANPQIADDLVSFSRAWDSRSKLTTISTGEVYMHVSTVHRFFKEQFMDKGMRTMASMNKY